MGFVNPFARGKHDRDYPDVVIPIARRTSLSSPPEKTENNMTSNDTGSEADMSTGGYSIESLKKEVDGDVATEGLNTAYDRE